MIDYLVGIYVKIGKFLSTIVIEDKVHKFNNSKFNKSEMYYKHNKKIEYTKKNNKSTIRNSMIKRRRR